MIRVRGARFEEATALRGILTLNQTDATTQADVATLSDPSAPLPCGPVSSGNTKCEVRVSVRATRDWCVTYHHCMHARQAVEGGYDGAGADMGQYELCHYRVPHSTVDVILCVAREGRALDSRWHTGIDAPAGTALPYGCWTFMRACARRRVDNGEGARACVRLTPRRWCDGILSASCARQVRCGWQACGKHDKHPGRCLQS